MVKPRLYERPPSGGEPPDGSTAGADLSATLLYVLEETLALAHPFIPFVTEEIHSFVPGAQGDLAVRAYPRVRPELVDEAAERNVEVVIEAVRRLRNYRDSLGVPAAEVVAARLVVDDAAARGVYAETRSTIERLARYELDLVESSANGETGAAVVLEGARVEVLDGAGSEAARAQLAADLERVDSEIARARGKLANQGFTAKAPADVVQAERDKLERYERERAEIQSRLE
jgi:valyl-tRNA synthetase